MNQFLPTSLKLNVDSCWNSIHDMLESISINFHKCEDLLLNRNETRYLNDLNRKLILGLAKFLSLFKTTSEQLSADSPPTLHLVVPWFSKLKGGLAALAFFISRKFTVTVVFILIKLPF